MRSTRWIFIFTVVQPLLNKIVFNRFFEQFLTRQKRFYDLWVADNNVGLEWRQVKAPHGSIVSRSFLEHLKNLRCRLSNKRKTTADQRIRWDGWNLRQQFIATVVSFMVPSNNNNNKSETKNYETHYEQY